MTCLSTGEDKTVLNPLDMIADFKPLVDERDRKLYKLIVDERDFTSGSASGGEVEIQAWRKSKEEKLGAHTSGLSGTFIFENDGVSDPFFENSRSRHISEQYSKAGGETERLQAA